MYCSSEIHSLIKAERIFREIFTLKSLKIKLSLYTFIMWEKEKKTNTTSVTE